MPKYTVTEQVDDGGSFPIHRIFAQADTLADLANAIEDASIKECVAKHAAAQEAFPDAIIEAKPNADAHRERGGALYRDGVASGWRGPFRRAARDVMDAAN